MVEGLLAAHGIPIKCAGFGCRCISLDCILPRTLKTLLLESEQRDDMQETKRHGEAFEYYYSLGESRSYTEVARKFTVSRTSIHKWAKAFNWQFRITQRDLNINKKVEEKTDNAIVNTKADYRRDIRLALQPVKAAINKAIVKNEETGQLEVRIPIVEAKDLSSVIGSFEKLVRLDLLLMGEADSRTEHRLLLIDILKEAREDNDGS